MNIPSHVPPHLVLPFDYFGDPAIREDPHTFFSSLHHQDLEIFWNPAVPRLEGGLAGAWQILKARDQRTVYSETEIFSSENVTGFKTILGVDWQLNPLEYDPPAHNMFRQAVNPLFSPVAVKRLNQRIESRAEELIASVLSDGGCEFMEAFGRPFPVTIIMELIGLPKEELSTFLAWEYDMLHNPDLEARFGAIHKIRDYLEVLVAQKKKAPSEDFVSMLTMMEVDGRRMTHGEIMGVCFLLFLGGLDTVASSIGFHYRFLGTDLEAQKELRRDAMLIPGAVEEMLRRFSVVTTQRRVKKDHVFNGVNMKSGDWVSLASPLANLDPDEFADPLKVDFHRKGGRHLGFAYGPHFCLGSHLARRELIVGLEKWLTLAPEFRVTENSTMEVHGGAVCGVEQLHLEW